MAWPPNGAAGGRSGYLARLRCSSLAPSMAHTIVTDICEGVADCVDACPVACIHPGQGANSKGTGFYWIDFDTCIDCGICLQVCPVAGAILPQEKPELQRAV